MTTIDHRILIPAAPNVVWDYVSDITHNPDWQIDCRDVIFLTSRREGPGVRWRYAAPNGHEYVIAVTAWYNGLGYEYYFVDGVSYKENKGRIRLQEIPEGTIVQWTFTYELGGVLGGMRNALGVSRQVDQTIAESLKTLWQKIKQSGAAARPHEAKSLMRDAPDVDARSAYQPRHQTAAERSDAQKTEPTPISKVQFEPPAAQSEFEPPISEDDGQAISVIAEPPIDEGDTRPRPAAAFMPPPVAEPVAPVDVEEEPEFLDRMIDPSIDLSRFEPPRAPSDTQPRKAVEAPAAPLDEAEAAADAKPEPAAKAETASEQPTVATVEFAQEETQLELEPEAPSASDEQTAPSATEAASILEEIPPVTESLIENALTSSASETEQEPEATAPTPAQEPNAEAKSIWEVFGLPRPSETQETAAASLKPEPVPASSEPVSEPEQPAVEAVFEDQALPEKPSLPRGSSRTGLRIVLRRKLVRVRRP